MQDNEIELVFVDNPRALESLKPFALLSSYDLRLPGLLTEGWKRSEVLSKPLDAAKVERLGKILSWMRKTFRTSRIVVFVEAGMSAGQVANLFVSGEVVLRKGEAQYFLR